jgi:hypothetical protein
MEISKDLIDAGGHRRILTTEMEDGDVFAILHLGLRVEDVISINVLSEEGQLFEMRVHFQPPRGVTWINASKRAKEAWHEVWGI